MAPWWFPRFFEIWPSLRAWRGQAQAEIEAADQPLSGTSTIFVSDDRDLDRDAQSEVLPFAVTESLATTEFVPPEDVDLSQYEYQETLLPPHLAVSRGHVQDGLISGLPGTSVYPPGSSEPPELQEPPRSPVDDVRSVLTGSTQEGRSPLPDWYMQQLHQEVIEIPPWVQLPPTPPSPIFSVETPSEDWREYRRRVVDREREEEIFRAQQEQCRRREELYRRSDYLSDSENDLRNCLLVRSRSPRRS